MKERKQLHNIAALLLAATIFGTGAHAQSGGPLAPPGLPAPTMKSLDEVEARTAIGTAPFTITQPGSYYLTKSLTVTGSDGIIIAADHVALDLNGFTVSTTGNGGNDTAGVRAVGRRNLAVRNGQIHGFETCLLLDGCKAARIDGLIISTSSGRGDVGIVITSAAAWSRSIHVSNCTVDFALNAGVGLRGRNGNQLRDVVLRHCSVSQSNGIGIGITANGGDIEGVVLERCTVSKNSGGLSVSALGSSQMSDLALRDCLFSRNDGAGLNFESSTDSSIKGITIDRCEVNGSNIEGMWFRASNGTIVGCRITSCSLFDNGRDGIRVTGDKARGFHIEGNTLVRTDAGDTGIRLKDSLLPNYVFRNVCVGYGDAFDFNLGVTRGPEVSDFGNLTITGAAGHPLANFAR